MYLEGASLIENNFRNTCVSVGCPSNAKLCQKRLNSLRERLWMSSMRGISVSLHWKATKCRASKLIPSVDAFLHPMPQIIGTKQMFLTVSACCISRWLSPISTFLTDFYSNTKKKPDFCIPTVCYFLITFENLLLVSSKLFTKPFGYPFLHREIVQDF